MSECEEGGYIYIILYPILFIVLLLSDRAAAGYMSECEEGGYIYHTISFPI